VATLFTVGHSTRSLAELVDACAAHGIGVIADVRRFPGSRRSPHFARQSLVETLPAHGIAYRWLPKLGGRRRRDRDAPPTAWRVEAFAAYAAHMRTPEFRAGIDELLAAMADGSTAIMCAEASPYRCHRRLISDWAELHGIEVIHILDEKRSERHQVTPFARAAEDGDSVAYDASAPGAQLDLFQG